MQGLKKLYKRQLEIYSIRLVFKLRLLLAKQKQGFLLFLKTFRREDRVKKIKSIREHVKENEEKIRSVDKRITINKEQDRVHDFSSQDGRFGHWSDPVGPIFDRRYLNRPKPHF